MKNDRVVIVFVVALVLGGVLNMYAPTHGDVNYIDDTEHHYEYSQWYYTTEHNNTIVKSFPDIKAVAYPVSCKSYDGNYSQNNYTLKDIGIIVWMSKEKTNPSDSYMDEVRVGMNGTILKSYNDPLNISVGSKIEEYMFDYYFYVGETWCIPYCDYYTFTVHWSDGSYTHGGEAQGHFYKLLMWRMYASQYNGATPPLPPPPRGDSR